MSHRQEIEAILKQVELWPAGDKRELVEKLAQQGDVGPQARPRRSLGELYGIANPTGKPISDKELDDARFEALREKL